MTIFLDSRDSKHIAEIRAFVAREVVRNPDLNGEAIFVESGDYTCIDGTDSHARAALLASIHGLIDGRKEQSHV